MQQRKQDTLLSQVKCPLHLDEKFNDTKRNILMPELYGAALWNSSGIYLKIELFISVLARKLIRKTLFLRRYKMFNNHFFQL